MIRHAGLIARFQRGRWLGALVEGPSGAGKSDLALRALGDGWRLVADDRVLVWRSGRRLFGRAPAPLAGLIEARGLGVLAAPALPHCEIGLVARCEEAVERFPDPTCERVEGVWLPAIALAARELSAPAKLAQALGLLDSSANRRIRSAAPAAPAPDAGGVP